MLVNTLLMQYDLQIQHDTNCVSGACNPGSGHYYPFCVRCEGAINVHQ